MKNICTLFFLFLLNFPVNAQPGFVWAKQMEDRSLGTGYAIAVDNNNNVYTTGVLFDTTDFDPGIGIYNLVAKGAWSSDVFISKLDANGNFIWARSFAGKGWDWAASITVDVYGDVCVTGYFVDTVDFDPGAGVYNLVSAGDNDIFVCKLDANGNFIWAKRMGGVSSESASSIVVDSSGNICTTGSFRGTADFDPGAGIYNLSSAGMSQDIFVSKLDVSGNFVWAKRMGGTGSGSGHGIALDGSNNVYTTGQFANSVDFDPGSSSFYLNSVGYDDSFISKLDPAGNFIWAKHIGGAVSDCARSIAIDANNNVFVSGDFNSTTDFDPGVGAYSLTALGSNADIFIVKLDASGNFLWAKQMGGGNLDVCFDITVDVKDNIYTTGSFRGTVDFDPGAGIYNLTSAGYDDIFISKLDPAGNFVCAGRMGGAGSESASSIAVDAHQEVYTTGTFSGACDFDPGAGIYSLTSTGSSCDIFISKLRICIVIVGEDEIVTENLFSIYPNPSSGIFTIDLKNKTAETKICIYDVLGNCVLNKLSVKNSSQEIDLSNQSKGIYFLEIVSDPSSQGYEGRSGERINKKIIIQ